MRKSLGRSTEALSEAQHRIEEQLGGLRHGQQRLERQLAHIARHLSVVDEEVGEDDHAQAQPMGKALSGRPQRESLQAIRPSGQQTIIGKSVTSCREIAVSDRLDSPEPEPAAYHLPEPDDTLKLPIGNSEGLEQVTLPPKAKAETDGAHGECSTGSMLEAARSKSATEKSASPKAMGFHLTRAHSEPGPHVTRRSGTDHSVGGPTRDILQTKRSLTHAKLQVTTPTFDMSSPIVAYAVRCYKHKMFKGLIFICILLNALHFGLVTDWIVKHPGKRLPAYYRGYDYLFLLVFFTELVVRITAERRKFFSPKNRHFNWNVFDMAVMVNDLFWLFVELFLGDAVVSATSVRLNVVRVFRIVRLARVMRVFKVLGALRELRLMISGLMNCVRLLIWVTLLLFSVMYVWSVVVLQVCGEWLNDRGRPTLREEAADRELADFLGRRFPGLFTSMYTLFKAMAGGVDWEEVAEPLGRISMFLHIIFIVYIVMTIFCIMNIITAAFVDATLRKATQEEIVIMEHIKKSQKWIAEITTLFKMQDRDGDGVIAWEEFELMFGDVRSRAFFSELGLDLSYETARHVFQIFDFNGDGYVNLDEFAQGVHHFQGHARSIDVYRINRMVKRIDSKLNAMTEHVQSLSSNMLSRSQTFHSC